MITIKSPREIEIMARAGHIVAQTLALMHESVRPGVSTGELDGVAERFIRSHPGAKPSFKGLYGFPKTLCTSINEEIVHGIPSAKRVLHEGNILSVDVGVFLEGLHADSATTIPVGEIAPETARLLKVTQECLAAGIAAARLGNHVGDIGYAVQQVAEARGLRRGAGTGRPRHRHPVSRGTAGAEPRTAQARTSPDRRHDHRHRADDHDGPLRHQDTSGPLDRSDRRMAASQPTSSTLSRSARTARESSRRSRRVRFPLGVLLLGIAVLACDATQTRPSPGRQVRVLFVGNSLTYTNDLPGMVVALAARSGDTMIQSSVSLPNYSLEDHWNDGRAAPGDRHGRLGYRRASTGPLFAARQPNAAGVGRETIRRRSSQGRSEGSPVLGLAVQRQVGLLR